MTVLSGSSECIGKKDDRLQLSWRKFKLSQLLHRVLTTIDCTPVLDYLLATPAVWHRYYFPPKVVELRVNCQWKFWLPELAASDFTTRDNELPLPDVIADGFLKAFLLSSSMRELPIHFFFIGEILNLPWVCERAYLGVGWEELQKRRLFSVLLLPCLEHLRLSNRGIVWHIWGQC